MKGESSSLRNPPRKRDLPRLVALLKVVVNLFLVGGIQEAEDSAQFPRNGPTGNMIVSSKKRRGRPKGSTKAAGRNSNNNDSGDVLTPPFDGICDSTSESIDSRDESGKKSKKSLSLTR